MDFEKELEAIIANDPLGLLHVKPKVASITPDDRLIQSFQEINQFYLTHQREPEESNDINERKLFSRLGHIKEDYEKSLALKEYDIHGLLDEVKEIENIEDILDSDPLGLLEDKNQNSDDIFNHKFTRGLTEREKADFVAKRKKCKDFDKYEEIFKVIHYDLSSGKRKLLPFNERQIIAGNTFVHSGMLVYVDSVFTLTKDKYDKYDGRTKLVFENGTESNMKFRSLVKRLFEDGKAISSEVLSSTSDTLLTDEDVTSGFVYILKSLSDHPEIKSLNNLYKIGFSRNSTEGRIKNAAKEATYLMADVEVIAEFQTFNLNPQKLEALIHTFFSHVKLDIKLKDEQGIVYTPKEWFVVPLDIIREVIELIISREILNYRYDHLNSKLILK
jgi:hypothetical protein